MRLKFTKYTLNVPQQKSVDFYEFQLLGLKMTRNPVDIKLLKHFEYTDFPKLNKTSLVVFITISDNT